MATITKVEYKDDGSTSIQSGPTAFRVGDRIVSVPPRHVVVPWTDLAFGAWIAFMFGLTIGLRG